LEVPVNRALVLLVLALSMAACSALPTGTPGPTPTLGPTPTPTPVPTPTPAIVSAECVEELQGLLDELTDLNSRLGVGLNFSAYSERVGDVRVEYDRVDFEDLDPLCITEIGVPLEDAMNAYVEAYTAWNDCIGDTDCENDSVTPTLQKHWAEATEFLDAAERGLPDD
jgi:hypothetical protein